MRNLTLFISTLLFSLLLNAQTINTSYTTKINTAFSGVNKDKIPHSLLVDYAMEFAELSAYNGTLTNENVVHRGTYTAIYNTLLMARVKATVPYNSYNQQ